MPRIRNYHIAPGMDLPNPHRFEGNTIPSKSKNACMHCSFVKEHPVHNSRRKFKSKRLITKRQWARILRRRANIYG